MDLVYVKSARHIVKMIGDLRYWGGSNHCAIRRVRRTAGTGDFREVSDRRTCVLVILSISLKYLLTMCTLTLFSCTQHLVNIIYFYLSSQGAVDG